MTFLTPLSSTCSKVLCWDAQVLQAQNQEIVSPSDRSNLHPLVIPLAVQQPSNGQAEPMYTCLLRQVTLSSVSEQVSELLCHYHISFDLDKLVKTTVHLQVMPVVKMSRNASYLSLAARNSEEYLHR